MAQYLSKQILLSLLQNENIGDCSLPKVVELVRAEDSLRANMPDGIYQIDPRNGDRVLFNTARARRPHDIGLEGKPPYPVQGHECAICRGNTTGVVDIAPLSDGYTFINKNLFPMVYPLEHKSDHPDVNLDTPRSMPPFPAAGLHFLQWTSSYHGRDWFNMEIDDLAVVMTRLAVVEKTLLGATETPSAADVLRARKGLAYVNIIKNYGASVGGSMAHGHQQIALTDLPARTTLDNVRFKEKYSLCFSAFILQENPGDCLVADYGEAVLLVPYFMKRPYSMLLVLKDYSKSYLHELSSSELRALAQGWRDAARIYNELLPKLKREAAYNFITHNGPGAGIYFELLPFSQDMGGYEHMGLYVCQGSPGESARYMQYLRAAWTEH